MEEKSPLDQLEEEFAELPEKPVEELEGPEQGITLYEHIESLGGPSKAQIDSLKKELQTELFVLPIDEQNIFIYRPINRGEWMRLKNVFQQAGDNISVDAQKEKVVDQVLIWPRLDATQLPRMQAGTIDTLHEAVMYASHFLPSTVIINLVEKL